MQYTQNLRTPQKRKKLELLNKVQDTKIKSVVFLGTNEKKKKLPGKKKNQENNPITIASNKVLRRRAAKVVPGEQVLKQEGCLHTAAGRKPPGMMEPSVDAPQETKNSYH